jgi:hypothetical protein
MRAGFCGRKRAFSRTKNLPNLPSFAYRRHRFAQDFGEKPVANKLYYRVIAST